MSQIASAAALGASKAAGTKKRKRANHGGGDRSPVAHEREDESDSIPALDPIPESSPALDSFAASSSSSLSSSASKAIVKKSSRTGKSVSAAVATARVLRPQKVIAYTPPPLSKANFSKTSLARKIFPVKKCDYVSIFESQPGVRKGKPGLKAVLQQVPCAFDLATCLAGGSKNNDSSDNKDQGAADAAKGPTKPHLVVAITDNETLDWFEKTLRPQAAIHWAQYVKMKKELSEADAANYSYRSPLEIGGYIDKEKRKLVKNFKASFETWFKNGRKGVEPKEPIIDKDEPRHPFTLRLNYDIEYDGEKRWFTICGDDENQVPDPETGQLVPGPLNPADINKGDIADYMISIGVFRVNHEKQTYTYIFKQNRCLRTFCADIQSEEIMPRSSAPPAAAAASKSVIPPSSSAADKLMPPAAAPAPIDDFN